MQFWRDLSLSKKISVSIISAALLLTIALLLIAGSTIRSMGMHALREKGVNMATVTGEMLKPSIQSRANDETEAALNRLISHDTDVAVVSVIQRSKSDGYETRIHRAKKGYEGFDLAPIIKALNTWEPKNHDTLVVYRDNLQLTVAKVDIKATGDVHSVYFLLALSNDRITQEMATLSLLMVTAGVIVMALCMAGGIYFARSITKPLSVAVSVADAISRGDLQIEVEVRSNDEIGLLMISMKKMVETLRTLITDFSMLTDAAIAGRLATRADSAKHAGEFKKIVMGVNATLDAVIMPLNVSAEYVDRISKGDIPPKITAAYQGDFNELKVNLNNCIDIMNNLLGETEKVLIAAADCRFEERANANLFVGGWQQLVQGVNNIVTNIVNPLRAATERLNVEVVERRHAQELLEAQQQQLESLNSLLEERVFEEVRKNREKDQALMQREKMASIGQLAAGVAHEINNPMGYISGNLHVLAEYYDRIILFDRQVQELDRSESSSYDQRDAGSIRKSLDIDHILEDGVDLIRESRTGAEQVTKIVGELKSFSRVDAPDFALATLEACMESALTICYSNLKYVVTIRKEYEPGPSILCHPGQLNQVFLNLLVNAGQAITPPGEIVLKCWHDDIFVYASVSDTGKGIPEDILPRIFDPFFTTKDVGEGTGLGLSVSYDVVKKRGGDILVESVPGKGSTFTVQLPRSFGEESG